MPRAIDLTLCAKLSENRFNICMYIRISLKICIGSALGYWTVEMFNQKATCLFLM